MANMIIETTDVMLAAAAEQEAPYGQLEVRLNLLAPISQEELNSFHDYLLDSGVDVRGLIQQRVKGLYQVTVRYMKHAPVQGIAQWQLLIPIIPTAIVGLLVGIGLFKIQEISNAIVPILLIVGGVGIAIAAIGTRPRVTRVASETLKKYG